MNVADIVLIISTVVSGVGGPATGVWIARSKPNVDKVTADKIRAELEQMEEMRDLRRRRRLSRLEDFADASLVYQRAVGEVLIEAQQAGFIPRARHLPTPPALPPIELDGDGNK